MDLTARMTGQQLREFVDFIEGLSSQIGFKVSSRGWGYILEQRGMIDKSQFDKVEGVINRCRREGLLPVDFVAEEAARAFSNVEEPTTGSHAAHVNNWVSAALDSHKYFTPDWWEGEEVYIQMVVEKIDLVTLFQPLCARFHVPIALDCLDPEAPQNGRDMDPFHAGCAVMRALYADVRRARKILKRVTAAVRAENEWTCPHQTDHGMPCEECGRKLTAVQSELSDAIAKL
jgi:hypothetical protein